jgi:hypothetical protein
MALLRKKAIKSWAWGEITPSANHGEKAKSIKLIIQRLQFSFFSAPMPRRPVDHDAFFLYLVFNSFGHRRTLPAAFHAPLQRLE